MDTGPRALGATGSPRPREGSTAERSSRINRGQTTISDERRQPRFRRFQDVEWIREIGVCPQLWRDRSHGGCRRNPLLLALGGPRLERFSRRPSLAAPPAEPLAELLHVGEENRRHEERQHLREEQPPDDSETQRTARFGASAEAERDRQ